MGEREHSVKVYPKRIESPVFQAGGSYSLVFIRGKIKQKSPALVCAEPCILDTSSLGLFGAAVVHFRDAKGRRNAYQQKLINFEVLDCNYSASGSLIGELSVDIAALMDASPDSCNTERGFDFRMCGFGASMVLNVVVQRLVNGAPAGPAPPLTTPSAAPAAAPAKQQGTYVPRDQALKLLSSVEQRARGASGQKLASAAATASRLTDAYLFQLPRRAQMLNKDIEEEAGALLPAVADGASDALLLAKLAASRERLAALRRAEKEITDRDAAVLGFIEREGVIPPGLEDDPPLFLVVLSRYAAACGAPIPQKIVAPPPEPQPTPTTFNTQRPSKSTHTVPPSGVTAGIPAPMPDLFATTTKRPPPTPATVTPAPGPDAGMFESTTKRPQQKAPAAADGSSLEPTMFQHNSSPKKDRAPPAKFGDLNGVNLFEQREEGGTAEKPVPAARPAPGGLGANMFTAQGAGAHQDNDGHGGAGAGSSRFGDLKPDLFGNAMERNSSFHASSNLPEVNFGGGAADGGAFRSAHADPQPRGGSNPFGGGGMNMFAATNTSGSAFTASEHTHTRNGSNPFGDMSD